MGKTTNISWTQHTFNCWRGCTRCSPGCVNCYAETLSSRNPRVLGRWGPKGTRVFAAPGAWSEVLRWQKSAALAGRRDLVFVNSMSDLFEDWTGPMLDSHEKVLEINEEISSTLQERMEYQEASRKANHVLWPEIYPDMYRQRPMNMNDARARFWELVPKCQNLVFQCLTKRPDNIATMMPAGIWPNVWLGVSVENQEYTWRLDALQEFSAHVKVPVRFCSAEPLLGPVKLAPGILGSDAINWVIIGGESGGQARQCNLSWVYDLLEQCQQAATACFVKQLGQNRVATSSDRRIPLDLALTNNLVGIKGTEVTGWPVNLQVQEFPCGYVPG